MSAAELRRVRCWLAFFMAGLVLSGLTAFATQTEAEWLAGQVAPDGGLHAWIVLVRDGLQQTNARYPFIAYGTDWLAFGHIVIASFFVAAWRDPVRYRWVFDSGLIACAGVIPLALVCGAVRGIPWGWRLIDCSFGVVGAVPLLMCRRYVANEIFGDDISTTT